MADLKAFKVADNDVVKKISGTQYQIEFEVKTGGVLKGRTKYTIFTEDNAGLAAFKKAATIKDVRDRNRQARTDAGNKFRVGPKLDELGLTKAQRSSYDAVKKTNPSMAAELLIILQNENE